MFIMNKILENINWFRGTSYFSNVFSFLYFKFLNVRVQYYYNSSRSLGAFFGVFNFYCFFRSLSGFGVFYHYYFKYSALYYGKYCSRTYFYCYFMDISFFYIMSKVIYFKNFLDMYPSKLNSGQWIRKKQSVNTGGRVKSIWAF